MVDFAKTVGGLWLGLILSLVIFGVILTAIRLLFRGFMRALGRPQPKSNAVWPFRWP
jgi:hypothetical protein